MGIDGILQGTKNQSESQSKDTSILANLLGSQTQSQEEEQCQVILLLDSQTTAHKTIMKLIHSNKTDVKKLEEQYNLASIVVRFKQQK